MAAFFRWLIDCILAIFSPVINFLYAVWLFVYNLMAAIGQWILDLIEWSWYEIMFWFFSFFDWTVSEFVTVFQWFFNLFPTWENKSALGSGLAEMFRLSAAFNQVFPITEMVSCLLIYLGVLLIWCIYRLVKSWIPTVSGS